MTVEELLKPRYKVIADYPYSCLSIGFIVSEPVPIVHPQAIAGSKMQLDYFDKYPHLFKKLEWWEEREPEYLPLFVKDAYIPASSEYYKVYKASYDIADNTIFLNGCPLTFYGKIHQLLPATEEEFNNYIKQNND